MLTIFLSPDPVLNKLILYFKNFDKNLLLGIWDLFTLFTEIKAIRPSIGLFLSQTKYIHDLLMKTKMDGAKPVSTPMSTSGTQSRFSKSHSLSDPTLYRNTVGAYNISLSPDPALPFL